MSHSEASCILWHDEVSSNQRSSSSDSVTDVSEYLFRLPISKVLGTLLNGVVNPGSGRNAGAMPSQGSSPDPRLARQLCLFRSLPLWKPSRGILNG